MVFFERDLGDGEYYHFNQIILWYYVYVDKTMLILFYVVLTTFIFIIKNDQTTEYI